MGHHESQFQLMGHHEPQFQLMGHHESQFVGHIDPWFKVPHAWLKVPHGIVMLLNPGKIFHMKMTTAHKNPVTVIITRVLNPVIVIITRVCSYYNFVKE